VTTDKVVPALARAAIYGFLARAFAEPRAGVIEDLRDAVRGVPEALETLGGHVGRDAVAQLVPVIGTLDTQALQAAYVRCFGHGISKECPPYEAEYAQPHIFQKTQCLADVAGFYRAFGLQLATDFHDRPDHVSAELEFMEFLCFKEIHGTERHPEARLAVGREAQVKFLGEHLGRWVFAFCRRLQDKAAGTHYRPLAALLRVFAASELRARGFDPAEVAGPDRLEQETPAPAGCGAHCPAAPSNPAAGGCP